MARRATEDGVAQVVPVGGPQQTLTEKPDGDGQAAEVA